MPVHNPLAVLLAVLPLAMSGCEIMITMPLMSSLPNSPPGIVDTIVVSTAGAAQTQTAAFITPSPTATFTPTATRTPTATPTSTPTFIFILRGASTPGLIYETPITVATSVAAAYPTESLDGCALLSQTPVNGSHISANGSFTVAWKVKNTGSRTWHTDDVEFAYFSGTRMYKKQVYDLPVDIPRGEYVTLKVPMTAPKNAGTYRTVWSLRRDQFAYPNPRTDDFCHVDLTIRVP
jgi:Ig-like domain from next to BRCA1 gene